MRLIVFTYVGTGERDTHKKHREMEKRAQLPTATFKSLCRICLLRAGNDAFNDDLIDGEDNVKKEINIDHHVNNNEINSIQKMFSIHQTMIGNYLVRDLISSITQLEVSRHELINPFFNHGLF